MTPFSKIFLLASFFAVNLLLVHGASALACNDQADGNWGSAATWSCGAIPGSGDTVTIDSHTVTLTQAQSAASVTMSGGTFNMASYTLTDSGSWTYTSGTLNAGTGTLKFNSCGNTFAPGSASYNNIEDALSGGCGMTVSGTGTVLGNLSFTGGATSLDTGTLNVWGNITYPVANTQSSSATINISGTGNQTLSSAGGGYYPNISVNKPSGKLTLSGTIPVRNWTHIAGNVDAGTSMLKINGCGATFTPGNIIYYNVDGASVGGCSVTLASNLRLSNSFSQAGVGGIFLTNGYSVITKNFSSGSGTVNLGASVVKISGNITNTGVLDSNTSTVVLTGTDQSITGATTFYNLYKMLPAGTPDTLTFGASATYTIASGGTARFIGSRDGLLSLRSSSPGTAYTLTKTGSINAEYVDMQDCTVSAATTARASLNTSGNTNWTFTREFVSKIRSTGGDYTTLSGWESAVDCSLTSSFTRVFSHGGITGAIPDNTGVTGVTSGASGTVLHATASQILIKSILGTFQSGEQVQLNGSNYIIISDAGFSPIAVAEVYNDWSAAGLNDSVGLSGWTTGADNYILIVAPQRQRHQGLLKDPATGWYRGFTLKPTSSTAWGILNGQHYSRIEGVAVDGTNITTANFSFGFGSGVRGNRLLSANGVNGFSLEFGAFVANSLAYDATGKCFEDFDGYANSYTVYNSTARGCAYGFYGDNTTTAITLKNVLASGNTTADFSLTNTGAKSVTYSASSDATADDYGTPTGDRVSQTFSFMDAAGKDFRLGPKDSGARDFGMDLSSDATYPLIDDVEYESRPAIDPYDMNSAVWDIGADEMDPDTPRIKDGVRLKGGVRLR